MKPTEDLKQEHKAIKTMLGIMTRIADDIRNGKEFDVKDIENIVNFLRVFADKCHHGKEENVLFPALIASGMPAENGPVSVMLHEHTLGRGYIKEISDGVDNWKNHQMTADKLIATAMTNYVTLLQNHILKEENVLFMMADRMLAAATQADIAQRFEQIEEEVVGHGVHEGFHQLLDELIKKYPE
jgi:hemerythrin-like domain-containing protein